MAYLKDGDPIPTSGKGAKLSHRMIRFVDEFMVDMNGSAAVARAGFKTQNPNRRATELLNHPLIKKEIDRRMEKKQQNSEVRAEYLINKLIKIIEATEDDNPQAALRAIELAGKSIALWKERQEISGPDGQAIEVEQRTQKDVEDFKGRIASIASRGGEGGVTKFPDPASDRKS